MKKITYLFGSFFAGLFLFLQSCSTDVNINGDFTPVAVVYGILNQNDSIHYLKITRSYSGNGNTLQSATIPDSSYWNMVEVYVYEIDKPIIPNQNTWDTTRVWQLTDTILNTKDTNGIFFSPENKVYYFTTANTAIGKLQDDHYYHFKAILNEGEQVVSGQTELVHVDNGTAKMSIRKPSANGTWNMALANSSIDDVYSTTPVEWDLGNASIFEVNLYYLYEEYVGGVPTMKEVKWGLGEYICDNCSNSRFTIIVNGKQFYQHIAANVPDDASVDKRIDKGVRLEITGGAEELYKYIQISEPSSSLSQNQPTYTNLDGGFGLFTSRTTISQYKVAYDPASSFLRGLSKNSLKELCSGQYTGHLKFCSEHPADNGEIWTCN